MSVICPPSAHRYYRAPREAVQVPVLVQASHAINTMPRMEHGHQ
eukprot:CAMPEP_0184376362 /NCGR_PEP_ID=MMETSP0007-20130409/1389_1 /TAXON_ID=97485 /ORGANISM="Prymnesium parvum, Strain Texoma1" /LENGTH=43 /DNA_ID= /DNA_START= /DNA_END= /DNA_ORIENTATION=